MTQFIVLFLFPALVVAAPDTDNVSIMTYNVENLFNTTHDAGKEDYTYLPLSWKNSPKNAASHRKYCGRLAKKTWQRDCRHLDWNQATLEDKMARLAKVILQVNEGKGPDVLALQEVENIDALRQLRDGPLAAANYKTTVLIEGADRRGIDVALLSRLDKAAGGAKLHSSPVHTRKGRPTRGILQVNLALPDGEILTVFVLHFPAPYHRWTARQASLNFLDKIAASLPMGRAHVATGDFNIPSREEKKKRLLSSRSHRWVLPHEIGCKGCKGTVYYPPKKEWSFFDLVLASRNLDLTAKGKWYLDSSSVTVPDQAPHQLTSNGFPNRYKVSGQGPSDHLPMLVRLRQRDTK